LRRCRVGFEGIRIGEHHELPLSVKVCKTEQQATPTSKYSARNVDSQYSSSKRSADRGRRCATSHEASLADGGPLD
jgi:hypothetical protein